MQEQGNSVSAIEYKKDASTEDGNSSVSLDSLGPVVVNEDGTMSRITNWQQLSEIEKKNIIRVLPRRNEKRLEKLRSQQESGSL